MAVSCGSDSLLDSINCRLKSSGNEVSLITILYPLCTIDPIRLLGSTGEIVSPAYAEGKEFRCPYIIIFST